MQVKILLVCLISHSYQLPHLHILRVRIKQLKQGQYQFTSFIWTHQCLIHASIYGIGGEIGRGIGVICSYFNFISLPLLRGSIKAKIFVRHPIVLLPENIMIYDNEVSALGKICNFLCDSIDSAQVLFYFDVLSITCCVVSRIVLLICKSLSFTCFSL